MSLLEQDTTRKKRVDDALPEPEKELKFKAGVNKEYDVKAIIYNKMYGSQANDNDQIPDLYYLVLWKSYLEEKNTQKLSSAVIHLRKLINTFHKKYLEKLIATSLPLDSISPMARPFILKLKQKYSHLSKKANKRSRK